MTEPIDPAAEIVLRALRRTRQVREFTDAPIGEEQLRAILEVARWTGSSMNRQPWTFVALRDPSVRARLAELSPSARHVAGAAIVVAIVMPGQNTVSEAFDEGRAVERILVAATALGYGAAVGWTVPDARSTVAELLGIAAPAFCRSLVSVGHPTEAARAPKAAPGTARKPLSEVVREGPTG